MELEGINIKGFKSIEDISIPIKEINGSKLVTLLGKNESGKSNILEAINIAIFNNKETYNFEKISNRILQPNKIVISFTYNTRNLNIKDEFENKGLYMTESLTKKLGIAKLTDIYTLNKNEVKFNHEVLLQHNKVKADNYYIQTTQLFPNRNSDNIPKYKYEIVHENELAPFGVTGYKQLDSATLEKILQDTFISIIDNQKRGGAWSPSPEYLLPEEINLKQFAENPSKCIPLKNIFALHGEKDKNSILAKIDSICAGSPTRRTLAKQLSKVASDFLKEKWKEINAKVIIEIESTGIASISIIDEQNEDTHYSMEERSQGFKSFVSLLLSISIDNHESRISNAIIIIDEPEIHLHPSGIRWLLNELLRIGENNNVLISTHSNFLIDKKSKTRHFIIEKNSNGITKAIPVADTASILGDEILDRAFGIDPIRDFISKYQILVEGQCDKILISGILKTIDVALETETKIINGEGNNIQALASFSIKHNITPLIITDDDAQGRASKNKIKTISNEYEDKVFTLKELNPNLPDGSTIEDCISFAKLKKEAIEIVPDIKDRIEAMRDDIPFMAQLNSILKENTKEDARKILDRIKIAVSKIGIDKNDKRLFETGKAIIKKLKDTQ